MRKFVFTKRVWVDLGRTFFLTALAALFVAASQFLPLWFGIPMISPIFTSAAICLFVALVSHITRRVLFPDIDLMDYARKALEGPVGSAIVFLAVCLVVAVLVYANVSLLK